MHPLDLHNVVNHVLAWDVGRIAAAVAGLVLGGVLTWPLARWLARRSKDEGIAQVLHMKMRHQAELVQAKEVALDEQRKESDQKENALHRQLAEVLNSAHAQAIELQQAQQELAREREEAQSLNQRLQAEWQDKQHLEAQNWQLRSDQEALHNTLAVQQANERAWGEHAATLTRENAELQATLRGLEERLELEVERSGQLSEQCEQLKEASADHPAHAALEEEGRQLRQKIRLVTDLDGQVWEQPAAGHIPPFRVAQDGGARLIAVANLKGGVGKTTLTANLGAALAHRGYRVLLVDLDYQQSLTTLCLSPERSEQVYRLERLVRNVLSSPDAPAEVAWQNVTDLAEPLRMHLLATDERLVDAEERAKLSWLLEPGRPDVRYLFRSAFHAPRFQQAFDIILFDCPPRLTTACVNALACADFVLIPVLLDKTSADAVPRLVKWLNRLCTCGVCPELTRAGVVGNAGRAYRGDWIQLQRDVLQHLKDHTPPGPVDVTHFEQVIPFKSLFAEAAEKHAFAALDPALQPVFSNLVDELIQGKVIHESPRLATVP